MICHDQKKLREEKDILGLTVPKRYCPSWWRGHGNRERIPAGRRGKLSDHIFILTREAEKNRKLDKTINLQSLSLMTYFPHKVLSPKDFINFQTLPLTRD